MSEGKICKNCPFKKGMAWFGAYGSVPNANAKIDALKYTDEAGLFSCHENHPGANVFVGDMKVNDCKGFELMIENMKTPNKNKGIVNEFNETLPDYDLKYWANKSGYKSKLNLI